MRKSVLALLLLSMAAAVAPFVRQAPLQAEARSMINYLPEAANLLGELTAELYGQMRKAATHALATPIIRPSIFADESNSNSNSTANSTANSSHCQDDDDDTAAAGPGCTGTPTEDPDERRNVSEIIRSRGFEAQELDVVTADGYILTVQRIVNPLVAAHYRPRMRPVILQHGLMSSSVDWVINSPDVRPRAYPAHLSSSSSSSSSNSIESHLRDTVEASRRSASLAADSPDQPNALGFYLANEGYDVFLANSRGNLYGQRHVNMSSWNPSFWAFTFDEQIKYDLPATIAHIQALTKHAKIAYVGHSQGTTMALGLLADQPQYADVLEPIALLAPVAYANHCTSPVKYFAMYTPVFAHVNWWFGNSNAAVRYLAPKVCGPNWMRRKVCANVVFLACGFDEAEFDESRATAYLAHMPSGTSVKNIAHWGQQVLSGKFAHFDHGMWTNHRLYGAAQPPEYELAKIRSKALILFVADNDWLAAPADVARLRAQLTVAPMRVFNLTEDVPEWNHIDFVYAVDAGRLVNARIVNAFEQFRHHQ